MPAATADPGRAERTRQRRNLALRSGLCLALALATGTLSAADAGNGFLLWEQTCATCHGTPPDRPARANGSTATAIANAINNVGAMSFLRGVLQSAELEDLAAYLRGDPVPPATARPRYDVTDLWLDPGEPGWGLNLTQHSAGANPSHGVVGVLYLFDESGKPLWLILPEGRWSTPTAFSSSVYRTSGPSLSVPFASGAVRTARAGFAALVFNSDRSALLTLTVDGRVVTRQLQRLAF